MKLRHQAQFYRFYINGTIQGHNEAGPTDTEGKGIPAHNYWYLGGQQILSRRNPNEDQAQGSGV